MNYQMSITQECNLNCTYCFEDNKNQHDYIDRDFAIKCCDFIISDYLKSDQTLPLRISITGGEPLLRFDIVELIINYTLEESEKRNITTTKFEISTNATLLTQEKIYFLNKNCISLYIGSDGLEKSQNKNRIFLNGTESYNLVSNNLQKLFSDKLYFESIVLNMVVTPNNVQDMYSNYLFLCNISKNKDISISVAFEMDWTSERILVFREELKKIIYFYCNLLIEQNGTVSLLLIDKQVHVLLAKRDNEFSIDDCGAGIDAITILTDGFLYPCGGFVYNKNSTTELVIGNIDDGIDEKAIKNFRSQINFDLTLCKECSFLSKCYYYCPVNNLRCTGNMNEIPCSVCEINKVLIIETENFIDSLYKQNKMIFVKKYLANR